MPKEKEWKIFFDPAKILELLGVNHNMVNVADFGCGYGTFTISAAKVAQGRVYAFDIEPEMVRTVRQKVKMLGLKNVEVILRDFISDGSGLGDCSVDFVMLFNILHGEEPEVLLREAYRVLRFGGRLGIVHWKFDVNTPRGPPLGIRPKPEQCRVWAESVGFSFEQELDLKPYHYGVVMRK